MITPIPSSFLAPAARMRVGAEDRAAGQPIAQVPAPLGEYSRRGAACSCWGTTTEAGLMPANP
ncbi:hypothetical protein [Ramlibacter sp.]|uniref:hypothetical protein n=1 Tax=Ramlibacter sp. TaxID=1917967 RepID=UPI0026172F0F|nr:hypothetical protein [Ramlibacter sp.]MDB5955275.1 hypothetical protein [Ramlibacter sp.]